MYYVADTTHYQRIALQRSMLQSHSVRDWPIHTKLLDDGKTTRRQTNSHSRLQTNIKIRPDMTLMRNTLAARPDELSHVTC